MAILRASSVIALAPPNFSDSAEREVITHSSINPSWLQDCWTNHSPHRTNPLATVADPKMNTTHLDFLSGISLEAREFPLLLGWRNVNQGQTSGQGSTLKETAWSENCAKTQSNWREEMKDEREGESADERERERRGAQEEERTLKIQVEGGRYRHTWPTPPPTQAVVGVSAVRHPQTPSTLSPEASELSHMPCSPKSSVKSKWAVCSGQHLPPAR